MDKIDFYLRHRSQIVEWSKLDTRLDELLRDAVHENDVDKVRKLFVGEFGDAEVDFYARNRALIQEWAAIQTAAGAALDQALLAAVDAAGCSVGIGKGAGWTSARATGPELDRLREDRNVRVELFWRRQDLLVRGYMFPRMALSLGNPETWRGDRRPEVIRATRSAARELGMTKKDNWQVHWGMLDAIADGQGLDSYARACVDHLQIAAERLLPILREHLPA